MSSIQPPEPIAIDLKPTFGWVFIGVLFASVFYGVTVVQTLFYYQTYPNDRKALKILVLFIWILDTLSLIMVSHGTYNWLVVDFANPFALIDVPWSIFAEPLCTATIALCVHWSMAYRIYMFEPRLIVLVIPILVVSLAPFGVGVAAVIFGFTMPLAGGFGALNMKLHSITIVAIVFTASLDLVIATTFVLLIRRHKSHDSYLQRTNKMISTLTVYLLTNNLLTSMITASLLVTSLAVPKKLVYEAFNVIISKAYTNTFLAQLNAREAIRGRGTMSAQISGTNLQTKMEPIEFNISPQPSTSTGIGDTPNATVRSVYDMNAGERDGSRKTKLEA